MVEFGGLLGYAPIMPVNNYSCEIHFVNRKEQIPAPIPTALRIKSEADIRNPLHYSAK